MNIEDLLAEFGSKTGLSGLSLNEDRACRLVFDERWAVDLEEIEDGKAILLHSTVDALPVEDRDVCFQHLLIANLSGATFGKPTFGIDSTTDEIIAYTRLVLEHTDTHDFSKAIETLVNWADAWNARLNDPSFPASLSEDSASAPQESGEFQVPRDVIWL